MRKRMLPLFAALLLLCMSISAAAHDVPDLSRTGSISVTMHRGETAVPGGTLSLYRVGELAEDDGNWSFVPNEDYKDVADFSDLQNPELAAKLAAVALSRSNDLTLSIGSDGRVVFEDVEPALYLVVQKKAADGWNCASPFLISVPNMEDGVYVYDVEASPKVELTPAPKPPVTPPEKPKDPTLPQTGQLNWPIPLLAAAGLVLFVFGFVLRFGGRKEQS